MARKPLEASLFSRFPEKDPYPTNEKLQAHLLDQYKLYVEMADRISSRRQTGNSYFFSVNTALFGFIGYVVLKDEREYLWILGIVGLALCIFWLTLIQSYKQLNSAKFQVIHAIEQRLPLRLYGAEWELVGRGKDASRYRPLSHVELGVPMVFGLLHLYVFFTTMPWSTVLAVFR